MQQYKCGLGGREGFPKTHAVPFLRTTEIETRPTSTRHGAGVEMPAWDAEASVCGGWAVGRSVRVQDSLCVAVPIAEELGDFGEGFLLDGTVEQAGQVLTVVPVLGLAGGWLCA